MPYCEPTIYILHIPPLRFLRPSIFLIYKKATGGCAVSRRAGVVVVVVINALFTNIDRLALGSFHKKEEEEVLVYKPSFLPSFLCSTAFPASVPIPPPPSLEIFLFDGLPTQPKRERKAKEKEYVGLTSHSTPFSTPGQVNETYSWHRL